MSQAKFRVLASFDRAGGTVMGEVSIDRETNTMVVGALRGAKYSMPLSVVANWICETTVADLVRKEKLTKKAARAAR